MSAPQVVPVSEGSPYSLEELRPDTDHLVIDDGKAVDIYSEKQMRLLVHPLHTTWREKNGGRPFVALANVGVFFAVRQPPIVPDVLLSMDVGLPEDFSLGLKRTLTYFVWEYGKVPDVGIEVVSNKEGGELSDKLLRYARMAVPYYVVWDPYHWLGKKALQGFVLSEGKKYVALEKLWLPEVGLGLCAWHGPFEERESDWLRWCDEAGNLIATPQEAKQVEEARAEAERERAESERERADLERGRAEQYLRGIEQEKQRAELLRAQLRALGAEPDA